MTLPELFPFLRFLSAKTLASNLLDRDEATIRVEARNSPVGGLSVTATPACNLDDIGPLFADRVGELEMRVRYVIEATASGATRLFINDRPVDSHPVLDAIVEQARHMLMLRVGCILEILHHLPLPEQITVQARGILRDKIGDLARSDRFDLIKPGVIRPRVLCRECINDAWGDPVSLEVFRTQNSAFVSMSLDVAARRLSHVMRRDITFGPHDVPTVTEMGHNDTIYIDLVMTMVEEALTAVMRQIDAEEIETYFRERLTVGFGGNRTDLPVA